MPLKVSIIGFICVLFMWGCKKEETPTNVELSGNLVEYGMYLETSYWLYHNEATNDTDSVSVTNLKLDFEEVNENTLQEYAITTLKNFSTNKEMRYVIRQDELYLDRLNPVRTAHIVYASTLSSEPTVNLTIGGFPFSDVIVKNIPDNALEDGQETNYYIAKNYGIIRKEVLADSNNTWYTSDLIGFQVFQ